LSGLLLIGGRYEGVDERLRKAWPTRNFHRRYVLSGGELGGSGDIDTITRLLPGALGQRSVRKAGKF